MILTTFNVTMSPHGVTLWHTTHCAVTSSKRHHHHCHIRPYDGGEGCTGHNVTAQHTDRQRITQRGDIVTLKIKKKLFMSDEKLFMNDENYS